MMVPQQVGQVLGIFAIGFVAFAVLHLLWIGQYDNELAFQDVEHWNPIRACALHDDVRDVFCPEPFAHAHERFDRSLKTPRLTSRLVLRRPRQHTANKKALADVDSSATFIDSAHCCLLAAEELTPTNNKLLHGLQAPIRGYTGVSKVQFYPRGHATIPATSYLGDRFIMIMRKPACQRTNLDRFR